MQAYSAVESNVTTHIFQIADNFMTSLQWRALASHTDIVSGMASKLWDRIKLIERSLWILSPKAARSSQTGSPLTFNLMRNIFTVTFWKRVSDPIQHSGARHWAIYLSVLPIWTRGAKCVNATTTFYLLSKSRFSWQSFILTCVCSCLRSLLEINAKLKWKEFVRWLNILTICTELFILYTSKSQFTQLQFHFTHDLTHWLPSQWYWQCWLGLKPATFHYQYNHLSYHLCQTLNLLQGLILVGFLLSHVCEVLTCIKALSYSSCALLPYTVRGEPLGTQNFISPHV